MSLDVFKSYLFQYFIGKTMGVMVILSGGIKETPWG